MYPEPVVTRARFPSESESVYVVDACAEHPGERHNARAIHPSRDKAPSCSNPVLLSVARWIWSGHRLPNSRSLNRDKAPAPGGGDTGTPIAGLWPGPAQNRTHPVCGPKRVPGTFTRP